MVVNLQWTYATHKGCMHTKAPRLGGNPQLPHSILAVGEDGREVMLLSRVVQRLHILNTRGCSYTPGLL